MSSITSSKSSRTADSDGTKSSGWTDRLVFGAAAAMLAFSMTDPLPRLNSEDSPLIQKEGKLGDRIITIKQTLPKLEHAVDRWLSEGMPANLSDRRILMDEIRGYAGVMSYYTDSFTTYAQAGRLEGTVSREPFERIAALVGGFREHIRVLNEQSYMLGGREDVFRINFELMKKDIGQAKSSLAEVEQGILERP